MAEETEESSVSAVGDAEKVDGTAPAHLVAPPRFGPAKAAYAVVKSVFGRGFSSGPGPGTAAGR